MLVVHGAPGGSDGALAMGRFLVERGFSVVAPSRPGYPGTPLAGRETPAQQADLLAALLDALELDRVGVLCWSAGGPSGYALAAVHPDRVGALAAAAAVSMPLRLELAFEERFAMRTRLGNFVARQLAKRAPDAAIASTLRSEGTLEQRELERLVATVTADEAMSEFVLSLTDLVGSFRDRRAGWNNDRRRLAEADPDLGSVLAPTLLVHGDADAEVGPEHSVHAAELIPRSELVELTRGTHVALWAHPEAAAAQNRVAQHLRG